MVLPLGDLEKTRIVPFATYGLIALNVVMFLLQLDRAGRSRPPTRRPPTRSPTTRTSRSSMRRSCPLEPDQDALRRHGRGAGSRPVPDLADDVHVHVPARQPAAPGREHALPLDLRRQRRGGAGHGPLPVVYLACGLVGTLLQIAANPDSLIPTLGARGRSPGSWGPTSSGSRTTGSACWSSGHHPDARAVVIGFWIVLQVLEGVGSVGGSARPAGSPIWPTSAARRPGSSSVPLRRPGPERSRRCTTPRMVGSSAWGALIRLRAGRPINGGRPGPLRRPGIRGPAARTRSAGAGRRRRPGSGRFPGRWPTRRRRRSGTASRVRRPSQAVKYIWTAGHKYQGFTRQAVVAKPNVLSVAQTGLNHSMEKPVRLLSVATLNERIRKVAQTRASGPRPAETARYHRDPPPDESPERLVD